MKQCRICLEEYENSNELFSPCNCKGTQQYVHEECLEQWRNENINNDNYHRCQDCLAEYETVSVKRGWCVFRSCFRAFNNLIRMPAFSVPFNTLIIFIFGFITSLIFEFIKKKQFLYLNFTKPYDDVNIFFGYFAIGSVVYTTIVFIFYLCLAIFNGCKNNDNNEWVSSTGMDIEKLNKIHMTFFFGTLFIPLAGFLLNLFFMQMTWIYFLEYFFEECFEDRTKLLDIPKSEISSEEITNDNESNNDLEELLIED